MIHICNDCKYNNTCKEKFKEQTGMLCNNIFFQKEREIEWRKEWERKQ